ncbi:hypothetical protein K469DRAFT_170578 [Zopfia rhizophila CBS 207.26]|uniref:Uncharacterized protein n=1 Tax=Zopfia rhizophila CBS 207.26 TaxID=1314779 RepID=A0A6A6E1J9_9PEZI|nr:hypothetical protein K469DRAFT_170578 [Zopfia rhizophila CBS 207.26]
MKAIESRRYIYQCSCGAASINTTVSPCPQCGIARCAYCTTRRVQVRSPCSRYSHVAYSNERGTHSPGAFPIPYASTVVHIKTFNLRAGIQVLPGWQILVSRMGKVLV